jgi:hypothetical protein
MNLWPPNPLREKHSFVFAFLCIAAGLVMILLMCGKPLLESMRHWTSQEWTGWVSMIVFVLSGGTAALASAWELLRNKP